MKSIVGMPHSELARAGGETALCAHCQQATPINFQTCYAEDLVRTVPPEVGSDLYRAGTGEHYDWARVELSCRHPEGFSRWFLFRRCPEHPDDPSFISYYQVSLQRHL